MNISRQTYVRLNLALALIVCVLTYLWAMTDAIIMPWLTLAVIVCPIINLWDEFRDDQEDDHADAD